MKLSKKDRLRIAGIINNKQYIGPKKVNIHLNSICNFKCDFCWYHSPFITKKPFPEWQLKNEYVTKIIDDCKEIGVEEICLESDGETFLWPNFKEIVDYILNKGLRLGYVYTNGSFEESGLESFSKAESLKINLSAASEKTHEEIQSKSRGSFQRVISNILKLKQINPNQEIELIFILTNKSYKEVLEYIELAKKLQIDKINFKIFEATEETRRLIINTEQKQELIRDLKKISENETGFKSNAQELYKTLLECSFEGNPYSIESDEMHNDRHFYINLRGSKDSPCYVGWFYGFVDAQGRVISPCDGVGIKILGNIYKKRFKDIWFSDEHLNLLKEGKKNIDSSQKKWQECKYCGYCNFNKEIDKMVKKFQ